MKRRIDEDSKFFAKFPAVVFAAGFAAGILLGAYIPQVGIWIWLAGALVLAACATFMRAGSRAASCIFLAFLCLGAFSFRGEAVLPAPDRIKELISSGTIPTFASVRLTGVINGPIEITPFGERFELAARSIHYQGREIPASGNVAVSVAGAERLSDALGYGSLVGIDCEMSREDEFRDPGVPSSVARLDRVGVDAAAKVKDVLLIEHLGEERVFLPVVWAYNIRRAIAEKFKEKLSPATAGVLNASLLGDRSMLDAETAEVYREGGTFHLLVISGLHITFIAGLLLLLARRLTRRRWLHFLIAVVPLWLYTIAVGADLPVVRASLMVTAGLFGYAIYRARSVANSIAFAALILVAWKPASLFDASFHLTLASVAAIALVAVPLVSRMRSIGQWMPGKEEPFPPNVSRRLRRFCEWLYWENGRWERHARSELWSANIEKPAAVRTQFGDLFRRGSRYAAEALIVSSIVQAAVLPLSVIYFHRISLGSIVSNIWVGVVLAIESFAAFGGVLISHASDALAAPLFALAEFCNSINLVVPRAIASVSLLSFRLPAYSGKAAIVYLIYAAVFVMFAAAATKWDPFALVRDKILEQGAAISAALVVCLGLVVAFHPFSSPARTDKLRVDVLDVGQGDSILITFPNGETMLVDGGGRRSDLSDGDGSEETFRPDVSGIGERVVSNVLWSKGYSRVDYLVATHGDIDHTGGLLDAIRNFSIGKAILARVPPDDPEINAIQRRLAENNVPIDILARGSTFEIGGVKVEFLWPIPEPEGVSDNNNSLVMRLVFGSRAILLTGDIEKNAESSLLASGTRLSADVVKVPHHGSRTSSTEAFIEAVSPQWAVISVGRHSRFGHPHAEVVSRWLETGAGVLTTGEHGMITVETDGRSLDVTSFTGD